MALQYSRGEPARRLEARARARGKGARVEVVSAGEHYQARSLSRPGLVHQLCRTSHGWTCSCEGYCFTNCCLHLGQLERRAEREGWALGFRVAPRGAVPTWTRYCDDCDAWHEPGNCPKDASAPCNRPRPYAA